MMIFALTIAIFLLFLFLGVDIVFSFILTGTIYILLISTTPIEISVLASRGITLVAESYTILAVPLFILAACMMNETGITNRLVAFAVSLVGHIRGGLGHAVVVSNVGMAGMSGSATADAAGIGKVMIPSLTRSGYTPAKAAAISATAATLGPIIPPSIALVLYASLADVSLGAILLAGIVPGLMMALFLMIDIYFTRSNRSVKRTAFEWRRVARTAKDAVFAILMPLIILGGMFLGWYTPTEGAAMAVVYAALLGLFVYRTMNLRALWRALADTAVLSGAILLIIMGANGLSWLLTADQVGKALLPFFLPFEAIPALTLLIIALIALVLGTALEEVTMLILFTPLLAPVILTLGIDPIQFGVVFVLAVMIGLITPPVGISMFITMRIAGVTMGQFTLAVIRPFLALVVALVVVCLVPAVTLWLPGLVLR